MDEIVYLADGRQVPKVCVDALDEFEKKWPGASFHTARAGIACAVVDAFKKYEKKKGKESISQKLHMDGKT